MEGGFCIDGFLGGQSHEVVCARASCSVKLVAGRTIAKFKFKRNKVDQIFVNRTSVFGFCSCGRGRKLCQIRAGWTSKLTRGATFFSFVGLGAMYTGFILQQQ